MAEIVKMPRLGLNEQTSLIGEWFVEEGDRVKAGDGLFSIETDKSTMTVSAQSDGFLLKKFYANFDIVEVMTPVCIIGETNEDLDALTESIFADKPKSKDDQSVKAFQVENLSYANSSNTPIASIHEVFISPRAKKLANANGILFEGIVPSGAEGRIIESDIITAIKGDSRRATQLSETRTVNTSGIRRIIAKNMLNSLQSTAQLTSHIAYNASAILDYRENEKRGEGAEKGITIGDMVLFTTVRTLTAFDYMNAHMTSNEEIMIFSDINLGIAVDTDRGLMVPTIFKAQLLSLLEISEKVKELADKCRKGSISTEEMSGATFTISNLGSFGITEFTPILNPPQVGILGIGTIDYAMKKTPLGILSYPSGHLSLTYDHRAVDGAPSSRFLKTLCENLENFKKWVTT